MAIDTIPSWVRGPDVLGSLSAGASAGASAGRMEQENRFESIRLGLEAKRLQQSAALEQAQLNQAADQHAMEFQARQKLQEQNQERLKQQLNIQNAYKTAELGIAQGRLEETKALAEQKARTAALTFQREQGFATDVASGVPVMEAYRRNPVSPAMLNAVERTQLKSDQSAKPVIREGKYPIVRIGPDGKAEVVYTPETPTGLSASDKEDLKDLRHERDALQKKYDDPVRERFAPTPPAEYQRYTNRIDEISKRIEEIKRNSKATNKTESDTSSKDKVVRAHALGIAHPDWTKEQIIDAVNKEMP